MAIKERVFSEKLHLCMKGYCWRESRAKLKYCIVKIKIQLMLGKKNTLEMNEFTENETHRPWLIERVSISLRTGAAHKNRKRLVSPRWFSLCDSRKIHCLTSELHVKFHLKNRYRTERFVIRAISDFYVRFNVEFTRQAVNFSIEFWQDAPCIL